jgi:DNA-binding phage protein
MTIKLKEWNVLEHLKTQEDIAAYLEACLEEAGEDTDFIAKTLCDIAKAQQLMLLTNEDNMEKPSFNTIFNLIKALGFQIKITPVKQHPLKFQ